MSDLKQGRDGNTEGWRQERHLYTCRGGECDKHVVQCVNDCAFGGRKCVRLACARGRVGVSHCVCAYARMWNNRHGMWVCLLVLSLAMFTCTKFLHQIKICILVLYICSYIYYMDTKSNMSMTCLYMHQALIRIAAFLRAQICLISL